MNNSQPARNIIPSTAGLVLVTSTWGICFQRSRLLADNSTPSLAVRSNRAGSTESSYHLFRSEPAAARILRAEVSLKINCLGSGKASDHTEPICPQGAKGNQARQRWLNRCLLNNKEGSIANQQINLFSSLLIWPPTSQWKFIESMAAALLDSKSGLALYVSVLRTKVRMLIPYWKWNHKVEIISTVHQMPFLFCPPTANHTQRIVRNQRLWTMHLCCLQKPLLCKHWIWMCPHTLGLGTENWVFIQNRRIIWCLVPLMVLTHAFFGGMDGIP